VKALKTYTNGYKDLKSHEKVALCLSSPRMGLDHSFHSFVSETPQRIESLGEITTPECRPAARGSVWLWAVAKHRYPVALQWISTLLPGE
jgi:hypothetical protein